MTVDNHVPAGFLGPAPRTDFFDLGHWPVVFVRFPELHEEDRVNGVLNGLTCLLDQQKPFVAVWIPASHDHDDEPHEDEKTSNIWIKNHRDVLNAYCKGYVYVTTDAELGALLTKRIDTISGRLFNFPMEVVADREAALMTARRMLDQA